MLTVQLQDCCREKKQKDDDTANRVQKGPDRQCEASFSQFHQNCLRNIRTQSHLITVFEELRPFWLTLRAGFSGLCRFMWGVHLTG